MGSQDEGRRATYREGLNDPLRRRDRRGQIGVVPLEVRIDEVALHQAHELPEELVDDLLAYPSGSTNE